MNSILNSTSKKVFSSKPVRMLSIIIFIVYTLFMVGQLFLGSYRIYMEEISYNLVPFKTISRYIVDYNRYNFNTWFLNLFGNVIAFMPLGFLVPIVFYRKLINIKSALIVSLLVPVGIEVSQLVLRAGAFDIDDIILNSAGGLLGYLVLVASLKVIDSILGKRIEERG